MTNKFLPTEDAAERCIAFNMARIAHDLSPGARAKREKPKLVTAVAPYSCRG